jgi:glycosyltransferase involved in cell wall biosynthesis
MRALIFEPQFAGHNLVYVRHMIQALLPLGVEVALLTSRQATESEEFAKHLGSMQGSYDLLASDLFSNSSKSGRIRVNGLAGLFSSLRTILEGLKSSRPDHFYVPFGNPLAHALGLPNPVSRYLQKNQIDSEIVLLFGKYAYKHRDLASRAKEQLALQLLANGPWTRVHHIVPHAIDVMRSHSSRLRHIAHLLPDPIDSPVMMSRSEACNLLGLDPSAKYVSLLGLIDHRKGVEDLLSAAERLEVDADSQVKVLLAGKSSMEARSLLAGRYRALVESQRVVVIDRHLGVDEMWAACIASTLVTTPYPSHRYSASILIRAAAVGIPVLANRIGWMEDVTQRYGLGWTCQTRNPSVFAAKISEILGLPESYLPGQNARQFVEFHSLKNFQSQITEQIASRLGLGSQARGTSKLG